MALREIDGDPPRQRRTDFGRRGPWGALFARSGNNNTTTKGTDRDLTRRWAVGPANLMTFRVNDIYLHLMSFNTI